MLLDVRNRVGLRLASERVADKANAGNPIGKVFVNGLLILMY